MITPAAWSPTSGPLGSRRAHMAQDNKKFGVGMALGLIVGMLLYRFFLG